MQSRILVDGHNPNRQKCPLDTGAQNSESRPRSPFVHMKLHCCDILATSSCGTGEMEAQIHFDGLSPLDGLLGFFASVHKSPWKRLVPPIEITIDKPALKQCNAVPAMAGNPDDVIDVEPFADQARTTLRISDLLTSSFNHRTNLMQGPVRMEKSITRLFNFRRFSEKNF